jgi:hypothetical protein
MSIQVSFERTLSKYLAPALASQAAEDIATALPSAIMDMFGAGAVPPKTSKPSVKAPRAHKVAAAKKSTRKKRTLSVEARGKMKQSGKSNTKQSASAALRWALDRKVKGKDPKPGDEKIIARHDAQQTKEAAKKERAVKHSNGVSDSVPM